MATTSTRPYTHPMGPYHILRICIHFCIRSDGASLNTGQVVLEGDASSVGVGRCDYCICFQPCSLTILRAKTEPSVSPVSRFRLSQPKSA